MDSFWEIIGHFHPTCIHFPIALVFLTLICDIAVLLGKKPFQAFGNFTLITAVILSVPVLLTGYCAGSSVSPHAIFWHQWIAIVTTGLAALYICWRFYQQDSPKWNVAFSFILVLLISLTADLGGIISHGYSPFQFLEW